MYVKYTQGYSDRGIARERVNMGHKVKAVRDRGVRNRAKIYDMTLGDDGPYPPTHHKRMELKHER